MTLDGMCALRDETVAVTENPVAATEFSVTAIGLFLTSCVLISCFTHLLSNSDRRTTRRVPSATGRFCFSQARYINFETTN